MLFAAFSTIENANNRNSRWCLMFQKFLFVKRKIAFHSGWTKNWILCNPFFFLKFDTSVLEDRIQWHARWDSQCSWHWRCVWNWSRQQRRGLTSGIQRQMTGNLCGAAQRDRDVSHWSFAPWRTGVNVHVLHTRSSNTLRTIETWNCLSSIAISSTFLSFQSETSSTIMHAEQTFLAEKYIFLGKSQFVPFYFHTLSRDIRFPYTNIIDQRKNIFITRRTLEILFHWFMNLVVHFLSYFFFIFSNNLQTIYL